MTRAQVLRELRRMGFEEACGGWQERRLTQDEAARLLGGHEHTFVTAWTVTKTRASVGRRKSARAKSRHAAHQSTRCCAARR